MASFIFFARVDSGVFCLNVFSGDAEVLTAGTAFNRFTHNFWPGTKKLLAFWALNLKRVHR